MSKSSTDTTPEGFSVHWLELRESADHGARSVKLTQQLTEWAKRRVGLQVVELGTGTGSNLRYLCPQLGHDQQWMLYDNDSLLLQSMAQHLDTWSQRHDAIIDTKGNELHIQAATFSARVQWQHCDLSHGLDTLDLHNTQLLTGSALLDLTSARWLEALATGCIDHHCASLFVLNYNGSVRWREASHHDSAITTLLNAHQLRDKGFGPALGPTAYAFFAHLLETKQQVFTDDSDWLLNADHLQLQRAIIEGWGPAALEQDATARTTIERWTAARNDAVSRNQSFLQVGHTDVLSLPVE